MLIISIMCCINGTGGIRRVRAAFNLGRNLCRYKIKEQRTDCFTEWWVRNVRQPHSGYAKTFSMIGGFKNEKDRGSWRGWGRP